jgi:DNA-directed RNA polymerase
MMIHDSFATTAGQYGVMLEVARQAFHDMYANNNLEILRNQFQAQLPEDVELPSPELSNDFDIAEVLKSTYLFS